MPTRAAVNHARVELKGVDWLMHYTLGIYLLMPTVAFVLLRWPPAAERFVGTVIGITLPLAGVAFWWQRRALRYRRIQTMRTPEENYQSVLSLANREGWGITRRQHATYIQACVAPEWPRSYKRRATVLFRGSDVYVNSIMNPGRSYRPGMISWGGIERDVSDVAGAVGGAPVGAPRSSLRR